MLYNVGAVIGAIIFGQLSQKIGRRYSMIAALVRVAAGDSDLGVRRLAGRSSPPARS